MKMQFRANKYRNDFAKCFYIVAQNYDVFRNIFLYLRLRVRLTSSMEDWSTTVCLYMQARSKSKRAMIKRYAGKEEAASA